MKSINFPFFLFFLIASTNTFAQQLVLDANYGINGTVSSGLQSYDTYASDYAGIANSPYFMPDNSILLPYSLLPYYSATSQNLAPTIGIRKYLEDGSIDSTFGTNGSALITATFHAARYQVYGVTIQNDGKIILVGRYYRYGANGRDYQMFICRVNANGTKDATFGNSGFVQLNTYIENGFDTNDERFVDATVDSEGRIIAVGYSLWYAGSGLNDSNATAVRFLSNGTIDSTFGNEGFFKLNIPSTDVFSNVYLSANNSLLLLGSTNVSSTQTDLLVTKIDSNGVLDTTFGSNGMAQINIGAHNSAVKLFFQPDNKMMVVGLKIPGGLSFAKLNSNGTLDTSFSNDGINITAIAVPNNYPVGSESYPGINSDHIALLPDNKFIVTSTVRFVNSYNYVIARLNEDTTLDTSFMTNGIYLNNINAFDWSRGIHSQADGKVSVLVGSTLFKYDNFSVLGVNNINKKESNQLYPNPSSGVIYSKDLMETAVLYDFTGKTLAAFKNVNEIDLESYATGIYLIEIFNNNGGRAVIRVVKK